MTAEEILCTCGKKHFIKIVVLAMVSALSSRTGKPYLVEQPCYKCIDCGNIIDAKDITPGADSSVTAPTNK